MLILASGSPRRSELLEKLGIPFRVEVSHVTEETSRSKPQEIVEELALRKARAVADRVNYGIVLGADTIVVHRGKVLGKPVDAKEAYKMLYRLSGTTHRVYTGVAVVEGNRADIGHAVSTVRMKKIDLNRIIELSANHLDKAGAYAIQETKDPIAEVIKGSYENVVGLPLALVETMLAKFGIKVPKKKPGPSA